VWLRLRRFVTDMRLALCDRRRRDAGGNGRGWRREVGQASVETVALLPLVVLVGALLWQAVVAGQALWLSAAAARAAARAAAVGG